MRFQDAEGNRWTVRRRWLPWRRRTKSPDWFDGFDSVGELGDDPISLVLGIVMTVLLIPVLVLVLLVSLEFLLLLLLLPIWVLVRVAFGAPWIVVIRRNREVVHEEAVKGWSASAKRII